MTDPGDPTGGRREWKMVETSPGVFEKKARSGRADEGGKEHVAVAGDALRLAAALPVRLSYEEFKLIYDEIAELRKQYDSGAMSEAEIPARTMGLGRNL